jgi:PAS domain S-box-containing protein
MPATPPSSDADWQRLLAAAVESSPSGLLMVDAEGRIVLVNREVERVFGYSRGELLGQSVDILLPERSVPTHAGLRSAFAGSPGGRPMGAGRDLRGRRKDGTEVPVEVGLNPLDTEAGTFVLASVVDITVRKAAESERQALQEELRRAHRLEVMGTLASGMAHDFNNVLGAIMGYGEIALMETNERSVQQDLGALLGAVERGRQVVQRILGFSRGTRRELRSLTLRAPVAEAVHLLRATIPATIDVRLTLHPQTPNVRADPAAVHQILLNLATNAARAMPDGGTLEFVLEPFYLHDHAARERPGLREGPYARLLVRDDGTGIPSEVQGRVFEPFFTTQEPGRGSGLGLTMVSRLMAEHGGDVRLESEPGRGTTVECLFPAARDPAEQDEEGTVFSAPRGGGQRVLYVDDEPDLAKVGRRRLESMGYDVVAETDPRSALEVFRRAPDDFDVVVTDYAMPGMTGLSLADRLSELRPGLPIVVLTGYLDALSPERFRAAGVSVVLNKPVTMSELARTVHELLHGQ